MAPFILMRATFSVAIADAGKSKTRMAKIHRFIAIIPYHAGSGLQKGSTHTVTRHGSLFADDQDRRSFGLALLHVHKGAVRILQRVGGRVQSNAGRARFGEE